VKRTVAVLASWLAAGLAACLAERPRPAPPQLAIVIDSTTIHSTTPNDTLTGSVRADDPDGLDSIWLRVDTTRVGVDGLFETSFRRPFRFAIRAGIPAGTQIPVILEARDVVGFRSQLDSFVTVAAP